MRNVVICFTGFTERSDLKQWASAVHRMGGSVRPQLVTTTLSTYLEPVPEPVVLETTPVASPGLTTTNNNMAVHSNGVAGGASTTPSSTNTTQSVSSLSTGVEGRATALSSYFDSRSRSQRPVTHLVARIADGDKYRSAFTLSIPIVRPAWIEHSWRLVASKSPDPAAADLNFSASDPSYLVPYTCAFFSSTSPYYFSVLFTFFHSETISTGNVRGPRSRTLRVRRRAGRVEPVRCGWAWRGRAAAGALRGRGAIERHSAASACDRRGCHRPRRAAGLYAQSTLGRHRCTPHSQTAR